MLPSTPAPHHRISVEVLGAASVSCPQSCLRAASGTALEEPMRQLFPELLAIVSVHSSALPRLGCDNRYGESCED